MGTFYAKAFSRDISVDGVNDRPSCELSSCDLCHDIIKDEPIILDTLINTVRTIEN